MIATLTIIAVAFYWLAYETDWFTVRLESTEYQRRQLVKTEIKVNADIPESQAVKILTSKPVLMLTAGNPANYPMTLTTTVKELRDLIDQLSKTELELTEEVLGYDYSDQT